MTFWKTQEFRNSNTTGTVPENRESIQMNHASKTGNRICRRRKAADEESPGFTGQDAG